MSVILAYFLLSACKNGEVWYDFYGSDASEYLYFLMSSTKRQATHRSERINVKVSLGFLAPYEEEYEHRGDVL